MPSTAGKSGGRSAAQRQAVAVCFGFYGHGREIVAPVMRDIGASAELNIVEATHIVEKLHQAGAAPGPTDQPVTQSDGEKLR
jgi:hypothetical protein